MNDVSTVTLSEFHLFDIKTFGLSFSPIKVLNFESHYNKLQADSHYLLSEEYEVSDHMVSAVSMATVQTYGDTLFISFICTYKKR